MKKAFTLAEVMITLTVIGIITAVIIPVAINSKPDENVLKFKKAHNTLYQVISELVNSDKYYLNGDLGKKPDGSWVEDSKYFCNAFSDVLTIKQKGCVDIRTGFNANGKLYTTYDEDAWKAANLDFKIIGDENCKKSYTKFGNEIISSDDIHYWEINPGFPFGGKMGEYFDNHLNGTCFGNENDFHRSQGECEKRYFYLSNPNGMYDIYQFFCMDIDGVPYNKTAEDCDDVNDICPFSYGIRVDGKILAGKRATDWLEKSIQGEK